MGANSFSWSPSCGINSTTAPFVVASPSATTVYTITGFDGACSGLTTQTLYVVPALDISIGATIPYICAGSSIQISATGAQNFIWAPSNSLSSPFGNLVTASPSVSTNYSVLGYNTLGTIVCSELHSYSIVVIPNATANVSSPVTICRGESTVLTAFGGNTYAWSPIETVKNPFSATTTASPSSTTIYTVHSSFDNNCGTTGTVLVTVDPLPEVYAGRDTIYSIEGNKFIKASGTGTLTWTAGDEIWCRVCPETQIMPKRASCYTVEAENEYGCINTDDVCIDINIDFGVYIPDSFTPNGDGLNDVFYVYGNGISNVQMTIFDRWGERMFTAVDQLTGWPGNYNAEDCPNGIYIYKINYKGPDGKSYNKTGHVSIIR